MSTEGMASVNCPHVCGDEANESRERIALLERDVDRLTTERDELRELVESIYEGMRSLESLRGLYEKFQERYRDPARNTQIRDNPTTVTFGINGRF